MLQIALRQPVHLKIINEYQHHLALAFLAELWNRADFNVCPKFELFPIFLEQTNSLWLSSTWISNSSSHGDCLTDEPHFCVTLCALKVVTTIICRPIIATSKQASILVYRHHDQTRLQRYHHSYYLSSSFALNSDITCSWNFTDLREK